MFKQKKKVFQLAAIGLASIAILAGCNSEKKSKEETEDGVEVRTVKVAFDQTTKPISYLDDKGNPTGYDVEVMKLVDELLPEYEFEFVGTTSDDLLIGVEQGKYQVGIKNAFFTQERTEKFIFPKEFLGLSSTGLVLKKENEEVKTLADFAKKGFTLAPMAANNAQYTIIDEYNKQNSNNKIKLQAGDAFTVDVVQWVNEGRVDGGVSLEGQFKQQVLAEDGPYHNLKEQVVYNEFAVIKTWPLFNKKEQEFADAYDKAVAQLKEQKKTSEISNEFYGRDLFEVLETVTR